MKEPTIGGPAIGLVALRNLERWSWWNDSYHFQVASIGDGNWNVMAWAGSQRDHDGFCLSIQVEPDVLYLLMIRIHGSTRGRGFGGELYRIVEDIACEVGCRRVIQTPSGWTKSGDTRKAYLLRRGWTEAGITVFKDVPKSP